MSAFYDVFVFYIYLCMYIHLQINIWKPRNSRCLKSMNSVTSFLYQLFKENSNLIVSKPCKVIYFSIFIIFIIMYIYSYVYLCIYTPSYEHFKTFPVSNINSETSFVYQLFEDNSNFIVFTPSKVIYLSIF